MFRASAEISLFSSYLKTAIRNLARHRIYSPSTSSALPSASPSASSPTSLSTMNGLMTLFTKMPTTSIGFI